jgi:hypothetical protein
MSSLRDALHDLAQRFASEVLAAIRSASIEDLHAAGGGTTAGNPRRSRPTATTPPRARDNAEAGRLGRRSPADIDRTLGLVVNALKATRGKGLRSEQIQRALELDKRELPRVLRTGIATKKLRSKGQKRATVYFAT